jgi:hypothetical protein
LVFGGRVFLTPSSPALAPPAFAQSGCVQIFNACSAHRRFSWPTIRIQTQNSLARRTREIPLQCVELVIATPSFEFSNNKLAWPVLFLHGQCGLVGRSEGCIVSTMRGMEKDPTRFLQFKSRVGEIMEEQPTSDTHHSAFSVPSLGSHWLPFGRSPSPDTPPPEQKRAEPTTCDEPREHGLPEVVFCGGQVASF